MLFTWLPGYASHERRILLAAKKWPPIDEATLQAISQVFGEAFTNGQLYDLLTASNIPDIANGVTKWRRVYAALVQKQNQTQNSIHVIGMIRRAIAPARWVGRRQEHNTLIAGFSAVLAFVGLEATEEGRIRLVERAKTVSDAERRANELRFELENRGVHVNVLKFCNAELLDNNYFHAVFETTKSVADRIRQLSGSNKDGGNLAIEALSIGSSGVPKIAINNLVSKSDQSEQKGFTNLVSGFFSMFRNTTAHAPKIYWPIDRADALDIMTIASLIHRKLDRAEEMRRK